MDIKRVHHNPLEQLESRTQVLMYGLEIGIEVKFENCLQVKYTVLKQVGEVVIAEEIQVTSVVVVVGEVC
jgi:hypothetical protein